MARPKPSNDQTLIELFLDMLAAERGASANTLDAYRRDLEDFSAELAAKKNSIAAADSDALRAHLTRLKHRKLAPASVARRLSAIRQLYRFLYGEGHRGDDPAAVLEGPKRGRSLPKVLSIKQVDDLLVQARTAPRGDSWPRRWARTCCAPPAPAISCKTARICAWCRPCWATPIFRRHRSTRTYWRNG